MDKRVVLDTSAILAFVRNEPGADTVEACLIAAQADELSAFGSFATLTELRYIVWKERGEADAERLMKLVKTWKVTWIFPDAALCDTAAAFKARYPLSFADAFIAATAQTCQATLIHKDPEYDTLEGSLATMPLPYKAKARKT